VDPARDLKPVAIHLINQVYIAQLQQSSVCADSQLMAELLVCVLIIWQKQLGAACSSSFFYRYLDCWNALPVYVRQSSSLTSFKRQINLLDLRKYLKGSATDIN